MSLLRDLGLPVYRLLNGVLGMARKKQSRAIPKVELGQRHIARLRVVLDRDSFLRELPHGGVVAEVGVDRGDLSERILSITKPDQLYLVDIWGTKRYHAGLRARVEQRFAAPIAEGRVRIEQGSSLEVLHGFPNGTFDWIYIDTDHTYALTAAELRLARTKVKHGGIIAGHDFVTGNWDDGVRYGVVEAVHEFCVEHDWEIILLTHETDRHLSFALRSMV